MGSFCFLGAAGRRSPLPYGRGSVLGPPRTDCMARHEDPRGSGGRGWWDHGGNIGPKLVTGEKAVLRNAEWNAVHVSWRSLEERHDDPEVAGIPWRRVAAHYGEIELDRSPCGEVRESAAKLQPLRLPAGDCTGGGALYAANHLHAILYVQKRLRDLQPQREFRKGPVCRRHHFQSEISRGPSPSVVLRRMPAVQRTDEQVGVADATLEQNKHPLVGLWLNGVRIQFLSDALVAKRRPPRPRQEPEQSSRRKYPVIRGVVVGLAGIEQVGDGLLLNGCLIGRDLGDPRAQNAPVGGRRQVLQHVVGILEVIQGAQEEREPVIGAGELKRAVEVDVMHVQ